MHTWWVGEEFIGHVGQRQEGDHAVVSISLYEVMPRDGRRINVVLPERTNECLNVESSREVEEKWRSKFNCKTGGGD